MIKIDGESLFKKWCESRGILNPVRFMDLDERQILAWKGLAQWLTGHDWERRDVAGDKVAFSPPFSPMPDMIHCVAHDRTHAFAECQTMLKEQKHADETMSPSLEEQLAPHKRTCALRHGGIACTCLDF